MSGKNGLILTRSPGQKVRLFLANGQEITVAFLGYGNNGEARISFKAPEDIWIVRAEIYGSVPVLKDVVEMDENRGNR